MTGNSLDNLLQSFSAPVADRRVDLSLQLLAIGRMDADVILIRLEHPAMMRPLVGGHLFDTSRALFPAICQELMLHHEVLMDAQVDKVGVLGLIPANEVDRVQHWHVIGSFHFLEENWAPIKAHPVDRSQSNRTMNVVLVTNIQVRQTQSTPPCEVVAIGSPGASTARSVGTAFRSRASAFRAPLDHFFCAVHRSHPDGVGDA